VVNQKQVAASVGALAPFLKVTALLGARRGPILFQFPPAMKRDSARLQALLAALPKGVLAAFELQDSSWWTDETYRALAAAKAALCLTDSEELQVPVEKTAPWAYFRLRRADYDKKALARWKKRIAGLALSGDAFVYFKHEDTGSGPRFAKLLQAG
jgi:uncharacterized protein YecE (DUF72 family)